MKLRTVVIPLVLVNIVAFILQQVLPGFTNAFVLSSADVLARPWILFTSMFLHGGINHLLFNMYGLWIFGTLLEQKIGPKRFLMIYLVCGIVAAFFSTFFYDFALGASGAIMGIIGTLIILLPDLQLLLFFFIPMKLRTAGIVWAAIDAFGVLMPSGVANIAHLVGMGCGLLFGLKLKKEKKTYTKKFSKKTHLNKEDIDEYLKSGKI